MTRWHATRIAFLVLALSGLEFAAGAPGLAESTANLDCSHWLRRDWWGPEHRRTPGDIVTCARKHRGQDLARPLREVVNDRFPEDTDASATRALLAAGADPEYRDRYKWTPLTYWALNGRGGYDLRQRNRSEAADEAQVRALLEAGADPNTPRRGNFRSASASLIPPLSAGLFDVRPEGRLSAATGYSLGSMGIAPNQDGDRCIWPRHSGRRSAPSRHCSNMVPTPISPSPRDRTGPLFMPPALPGALQ